jgi:hypothetical protein
MLIYLVCVSWWTLIHLVRPLVDVDYLALFGVCPLVDVDLFWCMFFGGYHFALFLVWVLPVGVAQLNPLW